MVPATRSRRAARPRTGRESKRRDEFSMRSSIRRVDAFSIDSQMTGVENANDSVTLSGESRGVGPRSAQRLVQLHGRGQLAKLRLTRRQLRAEQAALRLEQIEIVRQAGLV